MLLERTRSPELLGSSLINKSVRMSMVNDLNFGVRSGIASSSNSSIPNNVMYGPPPSISLCHYPRFRMPNNDVMFNPASVPVHDPRSSAVQNNLVFKERKAALETCFYAPSMQPELATYNQRQLMPHVFHQILPCNFYHDIYAMKNKKQRF